MSDWRPNELSAAEDDNPNCSSIPAWPLPWSFPTVTTMRPLRRRLRTDAWAYRPCRIRDILRADEVADALRRTPRAVGNC